jgi:DNA-binding transcriptional ArsR family regulator
MSGDADIATPAALLADRTRAGIVTELVDGRALPPSELAARTGVARSTVSEHVAKLVDAGLLVVERGGRNRYYRLAGPDVAHAVEALAAVAPPRRPRNLRESVQGKAIRAGRTCYGHLAGALGVSLTEALEDRAWMARDGDRYRVSAVGRDALAELGIEIDRLDRSGRPLAKPCNDWTERRPHVAGPLGVALARRLEALGWIERIGTGRAVRLTADGERGLRETFGLG